MTPVARDPYEVLGVPRSAGADDIRKAFRKLAKKHHPDANPGDKASEERFKQVSAAFDILGDVDKRRKFDTGEIDADGREVFRGFPGGQGGGQGPGFGAGGFESADFSDILGEMFGRRGGRAGARGEASPGPGFSARGSDVRARLEVDLEEAILGGKKRISFQDGRTLDALFGRPHPTAGGWFRLAWMLRGDLDEERRLEAVGTPAYGTQD